MHGHTYYGNSIAGQLADRDRVTRASFTLHLNPRTTHVYLNTSDRNRNTRLVDAAKISLGSTYITIEHCVIYQLTVFIIFYLTILAII